MRILPCLIIVLLSITFACQRKVNTNCEKSNTEKRVVGYVAGYNNFDIAVIDADKLTHINYAFANIFEGGVRFEKDFDSLKINQLLKLKEENTDLKILFSIGGWVWSDQFSNVAVSEVSRQKFAQSAIALMQKYGFDGIDLDWEYPGQRAEDNIYRPSDKENFTLLLKEIRRQLDALDSHYLLTIATGADQTYIDHTNLSEAQKYLDFINIMTYDFYHGWHYQTGHHANFQESEFEKFEGNNVIASVNRHLEAGVPAQKLVVGIPFYGRQWFGVQAKNKGLYQSAKTAGNIVSYTQIKDSLASGNFIGFWDASANAPYAWNESSKSFISYENEKSLKIKLEYIINENLGGVMFWEYGLDIQEGLLKKINKNYLTNKN